MAILSEGLNAAKKPKRSGYGSTETKIVEKLVEVEKIVEVERIVEKPVEKVVEKLVYTAGPERIVEKIIEVPKIVFQDRPVIQEIVKEIPKEVIVEKVKLQAYVPSRMWVFLACQTILNIYLLLR